jgi:hypothetical protein
MMRYGMGLLGGGTLRAVVVLCLSAMSLFVPGVPVGTALSMAAAAIVGYLASRSHEAAELWRTSDAPLATRALRRARLCDDGAVALCVLALLLALPI